ncbi:MAG: hypothetical protein ACNYWU_04175, partial [Desulfobacterales bacterium]
VDEFSSFIDVNILGGLNNTIINNTRHASPLDAHLGGFFYGCKKKRPKRGVGPAMLSLGEGVNKGLSF